MESSTTSISLKWTRPKKLAKSCVYDRITSLDIINKNVYLFWWEITIL